MTRLTSIIVAMVFSIFSTVSFSSPKVLEERNANQLKNADYVIRYATGAGYTLEEVKEAILYHFNNAAGNCSDAELDSELEQISGKLLNGNVVQRPDFCLRLMSMSSTKEEEDTLPDTCKGSIYCSCKAVTSLAFMIYGQENYSSEESARVEICESVNEYWEILWSLKNSDLLRVRLAP